MTTTPKIRHGITVTGGWLVAGFNAQHQTVELTRAPEFAKTWATRTGAERWLAAHADAWYGLSSADARVYVLARPATRGMDK